ncbi:MAG: hypothetical protein JO133_15620 [Burkholderiaceae bacterium]|nr:hypothetical protein [Burkholderiaceae bacterium]
MKTFRENLSRISIAALLLGTWAFAAAPALAASKDEIDSHVRVALEDLYRLNPGAKKVADQAAGILVFPSVVKGGFIVGAEYGEGALQVGGKSVAYYNIISGSFGLQAGVQDEGIALMFMTADALKKFRDSKGWKAGVDGSVAIVTLGAGGQIGSETLQKPIIGFEFNNKGLMANLTLEGSKVSRIER